ncbi:DUF262 domain-containing protein [Azospirillum sp. TSO22-1]|uniref:DUF262 domain-containing protein n=1 Tax=Azospirillum sp. TSO22-1 TaxID=716789 RepID=UPI000D64E1B6|nr:DUF262 domain-containing protein [Azospirillum sp. TSO22-1]
MSSAESGSVDPQSLSVPLVTQPTRSQSESVETVINRLNRDEYFIPDYQRDSDQWDLEKESKFIESIVNNLTIPAFFLYENEDGRHEVVDGQQRLSTLRKFFNDQMRMSEAEEVNYLIPASIQYAGKKYSELDIRLKRIFLQYPLTLIFLPSSMKLSAKLEVFRRINEGGTPLTGQDIRLAYYSESKSVYGIRVAGIYKKEANSARRMIERAEKIGIGYPWERHALPQEYWEDWWSERDRTKGQTPSHMYLWYLVALHREVLDRILKNPAYLNISFRGTIDEALDIYCAQLYYQDTNTSSEKLIPGADDITGKLFDNFAKWLGIVLGEKLPRLSIEKYRQLAIFIAAATELNIDSDALTDTHWNLIGSFIQNPREAGKQILGGDGYPEPKGRWLGQKGQKIQFEKAIEVMKNIVK